MKDMLKICSFVPLQFAETVASWCLICPLQSILSIWYKSFLLKFFFVNLSCLISGQGSLPIIVFVYSKTSVEFVHSRKAELGCELVGSWTVSVGDMDQALHLWRYVGGFEKIDKAKIMFKESPVSSVVEIIKS